MTIEEKIKKILLEPMRNYRDGHSILSKNFNMPHDPSSWLNEREEYARTLSDKIPQKEPMLRQIQHSRTVLARDNSNDADDLRYRFYLINEHCRWATTNEPLHKYSEAQSKKATKAAAARWSGDVRKMLNEMVKKLAKRDDDPIDLWPLLYSMLDEEQIRVEDIEKPERCYRHQDLPGGKYTYETFSRNIRRKREK